MLSGDPGAPVDCRLPSDAVLVSSDPEAPVGCGLPLDADVVGMDTEAPAGCRLPLDADLVGVDPEDEDSMGAGGSVPKPEAAVDVGGVDPGSCSSSSVDSNVDAAAS